MPQKDFYHDLVRRALAKLGWRTIEEQKAIPVGGFNIHIDLVVTDGTEKRTIEVKSFISGSHVNTLKEAVGQYLLYQIAFAQLELDQPLFLALPDAIYTSFFQLPVVSQLVADYGIALVTFDEHTEEIVQWILP